MNKFEKLIEYVINDEDAKAQDLFHEIVVEKSREIYENLMSEEDQVDDLIDDIEADEEGVSEAEEDDMDMDMDMDDQDEVDYDGDGEQDEHEEDHEDLEDRVVDLEDQLQELMAEFEALMADEAEEPEHAEMDMEPEMEGMYESEEEVTEDEDAEALEEGVALKAAPAPVKSEEGTVNKKSSVAANAGAAGAEAKPHQMTGEEKGRTAPTAQDMIGKVGNTPAQSTQKPSAAPKAKVKGEESGTNAKSTL